MIYSSEGGGSGECTDPSPQSFARIQHELLLMVASTVGGTHLDAVL
jgi:hypothetical protein